MRSKAIGATTSSRCAKPRPMHARQILIVSAFLSWLGCRHQLVASAARAVYAVEIRGRECRTRYGAETRSPHAPDTRSRCHYARAPRQATSRRARAPRGTARSDPDAVSRTSQASARRARTTRSRAIATTRAAPVTRAGPQPGARESDLLTVRRRCECPADRTAARPSAGPRDRTTPAVWPAAPWTSSTSWPACSG